MSPSNSTIAEPCSRGLLRSRDFVEQGLSRSGVQRLYEQGELLRSGRGVYYPAEHEPGENFSLAEACLRVPHGVVCLLSALRFHELGTQSPHEVWLAIDPKARKPRVDYPPLRIARFSGASLTGGVEEHPTPEGPVRVYGVAKTVVDCFRFRNKIGLDVALEALRECWRGRRATIDEIWGYAEAGRIITVIRPYLEFLAA